jgi:hypothetical protein
MSVETKLDANQVLTGSYDEANGRIRVVAGVVLTDAEDSIKIGNGSGQYVGVTSNSLNVNITGGATSGTQYADGVTQSTPTGTVALGKNSSNVLHSLSLDGSGNLNVNLAAGSISGGNAAASPTGTAVPASADYTGFNSGGNLVGVSTANPLPVSQQGNITINALTNSSLIKAQLQDNAGTAITLGQKAMAASIPVALASDQTSIPVTGTFFQGTQPVSGTVTANQGGAPWSENITQFGGTNVSTGTGASGAGIPRVTVANDSNILASQSGTWNISNISGTITLPTGAATSGNQTTEIAALQSIDTKTPSGLTVTSTRLLVDGSGVTQPVSVTSLPLPTNAAQETGGNLAISSDLLEALLLEIRAMRVAIVFMATEGNRAKPDDFDPQKQDMGNRSEYFQ